MSEHTISRPVALDVLELIRDAPVAMLTTIRADGSLHSRPMVNVNLAYKGVMWFFTGEEDDKAREITENAAVNVTIITPALDRYVSLSGIARIIKDQKRAEQLWLPICVAWFPQGITDPHLVLIEIQIEDTEYWDVKLSKSNATAVFNGQFPTPADRSPNSSRASY